MKLVDFRLYKLGCVILFSFIIPVQYTDTVNVFIFLMKIEKCATKSTSLYMPKEDRILLELNS